MTEEFTKYNPKSQLVIYTQTTVSSSCVSDSCVQCCGSGYGSAWIRNFCLDPDPELKIRIRIQQKVKEHINKTVNYRLFVLLDSSIEQRMANSY